MRKTRTFFLAALLLGLIVLVASCVAAAGLERTSQPDVTEDVPLKEKSDVAEGPSYAQDIQPIFNEYCVSCHGRERSENGLRLDSYDNTMKGGESGAVVIPGWPEASTLVYVLRRPTSQEIGMPYHGRKLTPNRIKNVMNWIEAGAPNN